MNKPAHRRLILIIALLGFGGGLLAARYFAFDTGPPAEPAAATWLRTARPLPEFDLLDHRGQVFDKSRLDGVWSWLFFGFTHCPDICPTTMGQLDVISRQLANREDTAPVQVVFVSVDPKRDTIERLASYVPFFNPQFIGVTGDAGQIEALTGNLGVAYHYVPASGGGGDNYTVDHTAAIFLIDPKGNLAGLFSPPHEPSTMLDDFLIISGQT